MRAAELGKDAVGVVGDEVEGIGEIVQSTLQCIWDGLLLNLEEEASEVVAVEECVNAVSVGCEVADIDTSFPESFLDPFAR